MMKKLSIVFLSLLLLLALTTSALAVDINPSQRGDQGGQYIAEITKNVQNTPPTTQYVQIASASGAVAEAPVLAEDPSANEEEDDKVVGDIETDADEINWINNNVPGETKEESSASSSSSGTQTLDWYNVGYDLINKNKSITVYDINSGITWGARYINGKNHADVIPASQGDANKLTQNKITGSYVRRPVLVTIAGTQYAGSMYAVGHGETNYCNYFSGVMCIHFTGSQTHGSKKVDSDHQNAIQDALSYGY